MDPPFCFQSMAVHDQWVAGLIGNGLGGYRSTVQVLKTERNDESSHVDRCFVNGNAVATDFSYPCNSIVQIRNMQSWTDQRRFHSKWRPLFHHGWLWHRIISGQQSKSFFRVEIAAPLYHAYIWK